MEFWNSVLKGLQLAMDEISRIEIYQVHDQEDMCEGWDAEAARALVHVFLRNVLVQNDE